jgi:pilus assembly protein Flp/PilA
MSSITRFIHEDEGADLIEYALLVGLVSLAAVTGLTGISTKVQAMFTAISTAITNATLETP